MTHFVAADTPTIIQIVQKYSPLPKKTLKKSSYNRDSPTDLCLVNIVTENKGSHILEQSFYLNSTSRFNWKRPTASTHNPKGVQLHQRQRGGFVKTSKWIVNNQSVTKIQFIIFHLENLV